MASIRLLIIVIVSAVMLVSCSVASVPAGSPAQPELAAIPTMAPAAPAMGAPALERGSGAAPDQQLPPVSERLVIKNASLTLEVVRVADAEASIRQKAEQLGGFVVSVQTYGSGDSMQSTIVFRVPAARFEEALSGVEGLAKKVLSRSVSGDDVTEEYVDLESRLRNLEATRDRLLDLLARAEKVEDALQVNQALTDVQGQIEQIKGRMHYLKQSAAMSTITAELRPVPPPPAIIEEDAWQPIRVARESLRSLIEFGQGLVDLVIWLIIWAPVWLPIVLFLRWIRRKMMQSRKKPQEPAPPAMPPAAPMAPPTEGAGGGVAQ
ncbi:DUF4349 domain-containing protein [Roseiflexus sp.]|uniref:DUF4349 domain-containing protein n=1 Tax=Roseiflexus sp. TaxID=2562120 RepID=UPI0021DEA4F0|nr:DUF4349 domain-containing protein [Roseiflexus sp.]GIW01327.1 MAG: hypothetical protein KatS3mg058_2730 [Roseiflexus sp.]